MFSRENKSFSFKTCELVDYAFEFESFDIEIGQLSKGTFALSL